MTPSRRDNARRIVPVRGRRRGRGGHGEKVVSPWELAAPLHGPLTHHVSIVDNNAIYVIGGGITVAALLEIVRAGARDYFHVFFLPDFSLYFMVKGVIPELDVARLNYVT
jgi:hypothetical protein